MLKLVLFFGRLKKMLFVSSDEKQQREGVPPSDPFICYRLELNRSAHKEHRTLAPPRTLVMTMMMEKERQNAAQLP